MPSKRPSIGEALRLLNELSSEQKTLHVMNEDVMRAVVESREDAPVLRELVAAQHARVQALTEQMLEALRVSPRGM